MRYDVAKLEDQQIATLQADTYFSTVNVTTGLISVLSFIQGAGATADHIERTSGSFIIDGFIAGQTISVVTTGGDANATGLVVASVSALQLVLTTTGVLVSETALHAGASTVSGSYNDTTLIRTHAGEVTPRTFLDPRLLEGFVTLLPFVFIQHQGFRASKDKRDSAGRTYWHEVFFRYFVGARSLREKIEAQRDAYTMLAHLYDDIHGHWPKANYDLYDGADVLEGTSITTSEFRPLTPLLLVEGQHNRLIVNLPDIVVYQSDYSVTLLA